ncbi:MAG: hypothetical protein H6577_28065 [Lewinellaceae bacterium]|nr:hypothetical protein [Lewinellaceae bacterium]
MVVFIWSNVGGCGVRKHGVPNGEASFFKTGRIDTAKFRPCRAVRNGMFASFLPSVFDKIPPKHVVPD